MTIFTKTLNNIKTVDADIVNSGTISTSNLYSPIITSIESSIANLSGTGTSIGNLQLEITSNSVGNSNNSAGISIAYDAINVLTGRIQENTLGITALTGDVSNIQTQVNINTTSIGNIITNTDISIGNLQSEIDLNIGSIGSIVTAISGQNVSFGNISTSIANLTDNVNITNKAIFIGSSGNSSGFIRATYGSLFYPEGIEINSDNISLVCDNGNFNVANVAGNIDLSSVAGSVSVNTGVGTFSVSTGVGSIDLLTLGGNISLNVGAGGITNLIGAGGYVTTIAGSGIHQTNMGVGLYQINCGAGGYDLNVGVGGVLQSVEAGGFNTNVLVGAHHTTLGGGDYKVDVEAGNIRLDCFIGGIDIVAGTGNIIIDPVLGSCEIRGTFNTLYNNTRTDTLGANTFSSGQTFVTGLTTNNLKTTSCSIANLTTIDCNTTNLRSDNISAGTILASWGTIGNAFLVDLEIWANNITSNNLVSATASIANLTITGCTTNNLKATNFSTGTILASYGTIGNTGLIDLEVWANNITTNNIVSFDATTVNLITTNCSISTLTSFNITSTNLKSFSSSMGSLNTLSITTGNLWCVNNSFSNIVNINSSMGQMNVFGVTSANTFSVNNSFSNIIATNTSTSNLSVGNLYASNFASCGNIYASVDIRSPEFYTNYLESGDCDITGTATIEDLTVNGTFSAPGTYSPTNLEVVSVTADNLFLTDNWTHYMTTGSSYVGIRATTGNNGGFILQNDQGSAFVYLWDDGSIYDNTLSLYSSSFDITAVRSGDEKMRVTTNGVGFNTSSASYSLDVRDSFRFEGTSDGSYMLLTGTGVANEQVGILFDNIYHSIFFENNKGMIHTGDCFFENNGVSMLDMNYNGGNILVKNYGEYEGDGYTSHTYGQTVVNTAYGEVTPSNLGLTQPCSFNLIVTTVENKSEFCSGAGCYFDGSKIYTNIDLATILGGFTPGAVSTNNTRSLNGSGATRNYIWKTSIMATF